MKIHGACACGHIKFEGEADPDKVWLCHCADCQSGTGSAFRINIPVPGTSFQMLSGEPTLFIKTTADSGTPREQAFCPKCGSPIYSTTVGDGPKPSYTVRVGLLRERNQLAPKRQNWYRSAQGWLTGLASLPRNDKAA